MELPNFTQKKSALPETPLPLPLLGVAPPKSGPPAARRPLPPRRPPRPWRAALEGAPGDSEDLDGSIHGNNMVMIW